jgi:hypothetical protein
VPSAVCKKVLGEKKKTFSVNAVILIATALVYGSSTVNVYIYIYLNTGCLKILKTSILKCLQTFLFHAPSNTIVYINAQNSSILYGLLKNIVLSYIYNVYIYIYIYIRSGTFTMYIYYHIVYHTSPRARETAKRYFYFFPLLLFKIILLPIKKIQLSKVVLYIKLCTYIRFYT